MKPYESSFGIWYAPTVYGELAFKHEPTQAEIDAIVADMDAKAVEAEETTVILEAEDGTEI